MCLEQRPIRCSKAVTRCYGAERQWSPREQSSLGNGWSSLMDPHGCPSPKSKISFSKWHFLPSWISQKVFIMNAFNCFFHIFFSRFYPLDGGSGNPLYSCKLLLREYTVKHKQSLVTPDKLSGRELSSEIPDSGFPGLFRHPPLSPTCGNMTCGIIKQIHPVTGPARHISLTLPFLVRRCPHPTLHHSKLPSWHLTSWACFC